MSTNDVKPVLRSVVTRGDKQFETAVFYRSDKPDSKAVLIGQILLKEGGRRVRVFAFVNERKVDGLEGSGAKFLTLTSQTVNEQTGEIGFVTVAIGNPVNSRSDGGDVFFDTILFTPTDERGQVEPEADPIAVWVTAGCDAALHAKLGFTSARIQRPRRSESEDSELGGDASADDVRSVVATATGNE